jgi:hypothetical protein
MYTESSQRCYDFVIKGRWIRPDKEAGEYMTTLEDGKIADALDSSPEAMLDLDEDLIVVGLEGVTDASKRKDDQQEELDFEGKFKKLRKFVYSNPLTREVYYKTLKYCREQRLLHDLEEHVGAYPEFKAAAQSQYFLITWLVERDGLQELELDEDGNQVTDEQKIGLTEDEIDDLVCDFAYIITDVGAALVEEMDPKNRLLDLLEIVPEYYDTYIEVLDFLTEQHSFADVDRMLRGRPVLSVKQKAGDSPLQPSVFIDRLEYAGGIVWNGGWQLTPDGKELLETIKTRAEE